MYGNILFLYSVKENTSHSFLIRKCTGYSGVVERALDDPAMLIVTYEGEHNHSHSINDNTPPASLVLESDGPKQS